MKQRFSTSWIGSKQPRKQRKYRYNLPLHLRHKLMSANLTKDLRKKYGRRNVPVRKNDVVKVMRGKFKKKTGKVSIVNLKKLKVAIESLQVQKKDGTKVNVYFDPSNIQITELNLDDKERTKSLERKNAH
jgi:large subunit ribosomal protein L24